MFLCCVCGNQESRQESVDEVFQINGERVLVERIPARVCTRCGDYTFSRDTTEAVRHLVHGAAKPVRAIQMSVFEFA